MRPSPRTATSFSHNLFLRWVALLGVACLAGAGVGRAEEQESRPPDAARRASKWSVKVIVPEQHLRRVVPDPAVETELKRQLIDAGYRVIDTATDRELRNDLARKARDQKAALDYARKCSADILITGEAFSDRQPDVVGGLVSCKARIEIQAIVTRTGVMVFSDAESRPAADGTEAIAAKKCLQVSAKFLGPRLLKGLSKVSDDPNRKILLKVHGLTSKSRATRFKALLLDLAGVQDVNELSYDEGIYIVEVELDEKAASGFSALLEDDPSFADLRPEVTNDTKSEIVLEVRPK